MKILYLIGFMLVALTGTTHAGAHEDAIAAYERGDYATAFSLWRPLAENGDARAQVSLGDLYRAGHGATLDYAEAVQWYQRAAEQGDVLAQGSLGFMYGYGLGVSRDLVLARAWFDLAANAADGALVEVFATHRDQLDSRMASAEIAEARRLAAALSQNSPASAGCLYDGADAQFEGVLVVRQYAEQLEPSLLLILDDPICIDGDTYGPTVDMLTEIQVVMPIDRRWVNRPVIIAGIVRWDDDPWMVTEGYGIFFGRVIHHRETWGQEQARPAWQPRSRRERIGPD